MTHSTGRFFAIGATQETNHFLNSLTVLFVVIVSALLLHRKRRMTELVQYFVVIRTQFRYDIFNRYRNPKRLSGDQI